MVRVTGSAVIPRSNNQPSRTKLRSQYRKPYIMALQFLFLLLCTRTIIYTTLTLAFEEARAPEEVLDVLRSCRGGSSGSPGAEHGIWRSPSLACACSLGAS